LSRVVQEAGFSEVQQKFISSNYSWIAEQSNAIKEKKRGQSSVNESSWIKFENVIHSQFTRIFNRSRVENLILIAKKSY